MPPRAAALTASPSTGAVHATFIRSLAWTGAARWIAQALTWTSTLVVARILSPADYGIVAMVTVVTGFVSVISEFGVGVTVITLRDLTAAQLAQLHGLALILGASAFAIVAAAAPALAMLYGQPALTPVIVAISLTFLVAGMRTVPAALLQRDLRFAPVAGIETAQALAGAAIVTGLALNGWRHWSLVAGIIGSSCLWSALAMIVRPVPAAWPRRATLDAALTFTRHQLTGTVAWYAYSNADFAVAGRLLGAGPLGMYSMAWTLARMVPERLTSIVMRVTPAFFAALTLDPPALRSSIYRLTEALSLVSFPALVGLALTADDVVRLTAGPKWAGAVLPLRLLALYGAYDGLMQLLTRALVAAGDSRFPARIGLTLLVLMPPSFVVGARWGPTGIAVAWLAVTPVVRTALLVRATERLGVELPAYGRALWPASSSTMVMVVAVMAAHRLVEGWAPAARLSALGALGATAYCATLVLGHRERIADWRREWRRARAA